jgi:hypothetical protein
MVTKHTHNNGRIYNVQSLELQHLMVPWPILLSVMELSHTYHAMYIQRLFGERAHQWLNYTIVLPIAIVLPTKRMH